MQEKTKTYTTGEIAKMCNVSVRTVQFYDKEGIVSPSALSEGGRRIYNDTDLWDFRLACLYKNLGFPLKEIKKIMESGDKHTAIENLLNEQKIKIEEGIKDLTLSKEKLTVLEDDIKTHGTLNIFSEEDLNRIIHGKKKHRKTDVMTYLFLVCYILILIVGFAVAVSLSDFYTYAMIGIAIILLIGLIYYHSAVNAYICPNCGQKFTIGFFHDMISLNGVKNGKYLKCPHCKKRAWMTETFKDE